jgi:ppGpp synthetase/RelA/SpoT-type nucleotidyltranferase/HAMP domain-containing protein
MSQNDVPMRSLPLRWRLGLSTSVIVTLVLGSLTFFFQMKDVERSREDRERLMGLAMAPLASDIEASQRVEAIRDRLRRFEEAHSRRGYQHLHALLRDATGRPIKSLFPGPLEEPPPGSLRASVQVVTEAISGGRGTLEVWQDGTEFQTTMDRRWTYWALSLAAAVASILLSLSVAFELLIGRPLRRLLEGVSQMEKGYWSGLEIPRGAREMRWLAYRFRNLGTQLEETVGRLVEAERRAMLGLPPGSLLAPGGSRPGPVEAEASSGSNEEAAFQRNLLRRYLLSRCRFLESRGPKDSRACAVARETWERDVIEAEKLDDGGLKSRLEDAAFRILEPEAFEEIKGRLANHPATNKGWLRKRETEIRKALADAGVHHKALQFRVKHPAGIWRKTKSKGLAIDQIHDIIAFRIIVTDEQGCYLALKAIHNRFEPLLLRFKDYIAEPKANGYRSLHTCIRSQDGIAFEIQIRTPAMHAQAEGDHWRYKGSSDWSGDGPFRQTIAKCSRFLRIGRGWSGAPDSGAAERQAAPEATPPHSTR